MKVDQPKVLSDYTNLGLALYELLTVTVLVLLLMLLVGLLLLVEVQGCHAIAGHRVGVRGLRHFDGRQAGVRVWGEIAGSGVRLVGARVFRHL